MKFVAWADSCGFVFTMTYVVSQLAADALDSASRILSRIASQAVKSSERV